MKLNERNEDVQKLFEAKLQEAFSKETIRPINRAHGFDKIKLHGFIDSQIHGIEVFRSIPKNAMLVVTEVRRPYSMCAL